jgi:hypothetical protein
MATVSIPKESELQPYAPPGKYTTAEHGAKVVSCEIQTMPGNEKDGTPRKGEWLSIRAMFRAPDGNMVFAGTSPFGRNNTQLTAASASKARRFVKQLGFDPDNFDTEQVSQVSAVIMDVELNSWGEGDDKRYRNNIIDIYRS